jgi:hypothetical protein
MLARAKRQQGPSSLDDTNSNTMRKVERTTSDLISIPQHVIVVRVVFKVLKAIVDWVEFKKNKPCI